MIFLSLRNNIKMERSDFLESLKRFEHENLSEMTQYFSSINYFIWFKYLKYKRDRSLLVSVVGRKRLCLVSWQKLNLRWHLCLQLIGQNWSHVPDKDKGDREWNSDTFPEEPDCLENGTNYQRTINLLAARASRTPAFTQQPAQSLAVRKSPEKS